VPLAAGATAPLLELDRVSVQYGDTLVLDGVSLDVRPGEFLGVIGPNGSGKTTLLRVMLGLLRPTRGEVKLFGQPLSSFRDWRRVGYMPQKTSFDGALPVTAAEVVASGLIPILRFRRIRADERRKVNESLALVGMEKQAQARIGALSMGQQQRVLIARALVSDPELLLLDEPTASIDADAQSSFYTLLRSFNRDRGVTLVMVSHDIGVVAHEVSRVACLNRHILFCGPPADVLTQEALSTLYGSSVRLVPHQDPCAHAP
jgi:zinc transport system ATP-binding protein